MANAVDQHTGTYGFTRHEDDHATGLTYMRARYYSGDSARFIRPDPQRDFNPYKPASYNLYQYVSNNPVNAVDSSGLAEHSSECTTEHCTSETANQVREKFQEAGFCENSVTVGCVNGAQAEAITTDNQSAATKSNAVDNSVAAATATIAGGAAAAFTQGFVAGLVGGAVSGPFALAAGVATGLTAALVTYAVTRDSDSPMHYNGSEFVINVGGVVPHKGVGTSTSVVRTFNNGSAISYNQMRQSFRSMFTHIPPKPSLIRYSQPGVIHQNQAQAIDHVVRETINSFSMEHHWQSHQ
ncbi:RHS repeat-associated core domain-containing protein [Aliikangiella maris]|uniref:RHS repeat-associated core domain-containing protein n=2 Tax=Aliikangiella maris TaxID=3162458 RepID=A0ABV2BR17_9GAMM